MNIEKSKKFVLAKPPNIYWSIQGEGHLRGFQMCFVRLAGCGIGCQECDTTYTAFQEIGAKQIAEECDKVTPTTTRDRWVWITGGEPTNYDLRTLVAILRQHRFSVAIASAGHARVIGPVDWLSISPHDPHAFTQTYGNELKIVEGLHGLRLNEFFKEHPDNLTDFYYRYVQPLSVNGIEDAGSLARCKLFLAEHPNWSLSRQDHLTWEMP
jgi:organic radical activating enzyme